MTALTIGACLGYPLFIGFVILFDKIMAGDTYESPIEPLVVSSLVGPFVVLLCCLPVSAVPLPANIQLLSFISGCVLTIANWSYFQGIFFENGRYLMSIAAIEGARPVSVSLFVVIGAALGFHPQHGLTPLQWSGVAITACGIWLVRYWKSEGRGPLEDSDDRSGRYRAIMILLSFFVFSGFYTVLFNQASIHAATYISERTMATSATLDLMVWRSLLPGFWFGTFISGVLAPLLSPTVRRTLQQRTRRILAAWRLILLLEICAALGFCSELLAVDLEHPSIVAVFCSLTGILVMLGGVLLRRAFGISEERIPPEEHPIGIAAGLATVSLGVGATVRR